jgi:hypothetical protein
MKKVICFMSMFLFIGMATANVASADAQWTFMVYTIALMVTGKPVRDFM